MFPRIFLDGEVVSGEKKESTEYHNIIAWGRLAEIAQQFLTKGNLIYVEGRLQTRNWEDQQGNKKYKTEIIAEKIQLGPRNPNSNAPANANKGNAEASEENHTSSTEDINVEEIPF